MRPSWRIHAAIAATIVLGPADRTQAAPVPFCGVDGPSVPVLALGPEERVPTTGIRRLLFLRVRFADDVSDPISGPESRAVLEEVDQAFRRMSEGAFGLVSTVTPVLPLRNARTSYEGPGGFDRLVDDARAAGLAAGFGYLDYDLEIVRHSGVSGFAGGNALLGRRGAQVQVGGAGILLHEIGHNLGLSHANFWNTAGPGISRSSPPLPSHYEGLPEPKRVPVFPDSAVGHETITGPGAAIEYGDLWDIMGLGDTDFGVTAKQHLGWLPPAAVVEAGPGAATYRLFAGAGAARGSPRLQAVRVRGVAGPGGALQDYTIECPLPRAGVSPPAGVVVRWTDGPSSGPVLSASLVLDMTPWSPDGNADAVLEPGRTFSDRISDVHLGVVAAGGEGEDRWVDVSVVRGASGGNRPPEVVMDTAELHLDPGQPASLGVVAVDPDGDDLLVAWDFGDGSPGGSGREVTHAWARTGEYGMRVVVSDRRGGSVSAHRIVRVGDAVPFRVQGRVRDAQGNPVADVLVHNGVTRGDGQPGLPVVRARTDAEGRYALPGLPAGTYFAGAFHPDYVIEPVPPIVVGPEPVAYLDLVAEPLPQVTVEGAGLVPESAGLPRVFTVSRTGPTEKPLTVLYRLSGTAGPGDYARPLTDRIVIPAGSRTADLALAIFDDTLEEPDETVRLTIAPPASAPRVSPDGTPYTVYYPGYDYREIAGVSYWVLTDPTYVTGSGASAEVVLVDDDAPSLHQVSVLAGDEVAYEEPLTEAAFLINRKGPLDVPLTVHLGSGGTARGGADYEELPERVLLEPGETSRRLVVRPIPDGLEEGEESVELNILPDPAYAIEGPPAQLLIRDRIERRQDLQIREGSDGRLRVEVRAAAGDLLVVETSADLERWNPVRTNRLFTADPVVLFFPNEGGLKFFRTVRLP